MSLREVLDAAVQSASTPASSMQEAYAAADKSALLLSAALKKCKELRAKAQNAGPLRPVKAGAGAGQPNGGDDDAVDVATITDDRKTFYEQAEVERLRLWERFWFSIYMIIAVAITVAKILTSFTSFDILTLAFVFAYPWIAYPVFHYLWVTLVPAIIAWFPRTAYANLAANTPTS